MKWRKHFFWDWNLARTYWTTWRGNVWSYAMPYPKIIGTSRIRHSIRCFSRSNSIYRKELIRISRLIHSKPPAAVREFAKAFRFKKERE